MPSLEPTSPIKSHYESDSKIFGGHPSARSRLEKPLVYSGSLDTFKHQDLTPVIGREFEGLQVTDLLRWGDDMIRDLAVTSMMFSFVSLHAAANALLQSHSAASSSFETKMSLQPR